VHPSQRFSYSLLASLALWWPTLQGTLDGSMDPLAAAVRWVLAFVVATAGVRLIGGLFDRYAEEQSPHLADVDLTDGAATTGDPQPNLN
jgi:hypothetical protein